MVFDLQGQFGVKSFEIFVLLVDFRYASSFFGDISPDLDGLV